MGDSATTQISEYTAEDVRRQVRAEKREAGNVKPCLSQQGPPASRLPEQE